MSGRILVVDDLLPNIKLLEAKLSAEYYDVTSTRSGLQALKLVEDNSFDIILLDVMMPEMDGFEVCRRLKSNPQTAAIPVIMVTALSEVQDRINGLQAGADDFLTKPINELALLARIRSLLRLKAMTDELALRNQTSIELGLINLNLASAAEVSGSAVVIVDDNRAQAQFIADNLYTHNVNVKIISDSSIVVEEISRDAHFIDLVMVNTQLHEMDGLRLCTQLRSNEACRYLPQLIMVDEDATELIIKGLDMGVNDYLVTPVDPNEALARITTQIRRKRYQELLKQSYEQSVSMALVDGLTGIYNRRYFDVHYDKIFAQSVASNRPLSIAMIDIDHFKNINDTYGHVAGDEILKEMAKIIRKLTRVTDFAARYGGEEFVLVIQIKQDIAEKITQRLREVVASHKFVIPDEAQELSVTCSIGLASRADHDTTGSLLKRADSALYQAKKDGRNQVVVAEGDNG